jgi:hypothetical protein
MHIEQMNEMRILTEARAAIDANRREANELPDPERERRVVAYASQVEQSGRITKWLPPSEVRAAYLSRRSRFDNGDMLGRHCAG